MSFGRCSPRLRLRRHQKNGQCPFDDPNDWFDHRFKIFMKFCYPSIIAQTNKNFKWWILIDKNTPKHHMDRLEEIKTDTITYKSQGPGLYPLPKDIYPDTKWVITTRIDNDDCIHQDFIKRDCVICDEETVSIVGLVSLD